VHATREPCFNSALLSIAARCSACLCLRVKLKLYKQQPLRKVRLKEPEGLPNIFARHVNNMSSFGLHGQFRHGLPTTLSEMVSACLRLSQKNPDSSLFTTLNKFKMGQAGTRPSIGCSHELGYEVSLRMHSTPVPACLFACPSCAHYAAQCSCSVTTNQGYNHLALVD
jgi:hypothetical protein